MATLTITGAQRDALYDWVYDRLSGIDDIWLAASNGRYETADRLGREYSDELRLVLDDLGWGDGPGGPTIELTTPPDVLRRVFGRLAGSGTAKPASGEEGPIDSRELDERDRLVGEACETVLAALDAGGLG